MKFILLACFTALAFAQGPEPKSKASEYEVSGKSGKVELGAEFMVHSFSGYGQMFINENALVVEVALYPPNGETLNVQRGTFSLRINGKAPALAAMTPEEFVAALKKKSRFPGMINLPGLGGMGGPSQGPGIGGPFPRPTSVPPGGGSRGNPGATAEDVAVSSALPEGPTERPVAGFIYFPYSGKMSSVKSVELVYDREVLTLK